jgi:hypothetical protein
VAVRFPLDEERELYAEDPGSFQLSLAPTGAPTPVDLRVTVYQGLVYVLEDGKPVLTAADTQRAAEWLREISTRGPLSVRGDGARFETRPRSGKPPV